jgi:hypothetical protein
MSFNLKNALAFCKQRTLLGLAFLGLAFLGLAFLGLAFLGLAFLGLAFLCLAFLCLAFLISFLIIFVSFVNSCNCKCVYTKSSVINPTYSDQLVSSSITVFQVSHNQREPHRYLRVPHRYLRVPQSTICRYY